MRALACGFAGFCNVVICTAVAVSNVVAIFRKGSPCIERNKYVASFPERLISNWNNQIPYAIITVKFSFAVRVFCWDHFIRVGTAACIRTHASRKKWSLGALSGIQAQHPAPAPHAPHARHDTSMARNPFVAKAIWADFPFSPPAGRVSRVPRT